MILESTDNAETAQAFVDYVLSDEGQALVAETYLMPARTDIEGLRPGINELTIIELDSDAVAACRDEIIERFNATVIDR